MGLHPGTHGEHGTVSGNGAAAAPFDPELHRRFEKKLLADLRALERMIDEDRFERGVRRIGAEQEVVLVDRSWRPAPVALEVLKRLDDPEFTYELSLYNLEYNAPPLLFGGDCLRRMHERLAAAVDRIRSVAETLGAKPILTGILPTLRKSDLGLESITPLPRYHRLIEALGRARGAPYEFRFSGQDELIMQHDSAMLEACNTSCQFHYQVAPHEFAMLFNAAQAAAGPVLACAVNSPLLFGRRLWRETRIAMFQQAIDSRRPTHGLEARSARVRFGEGWVRRSVLELYREDIARFRVLLADRIEECPFEELAAGRLPRLRALQLFNSTVYRWNRACFGVTDGQAHLRIENRLLPSGPTVVDEIANAAFWFGLIAGLTDRYGDVSSAMCFDDARSNFRLAARSGLEAHLAWLDGVPRPAPELVRAELLPLARAGLLERGIDAADVDRYLGIVEARVAARRTGAQWLLDSYRRLDRDRSPLQRLDRVVAESWRHQVEDRPVHEWDSVDSAGGVDGFHRVDQIMTTDVFTVRDDDVIDLAASIMDWKHVRHVPVENAEHELVGLVSYRQLLRFLAQDLPHGPSHPVAVREVMVADPVTVAPETPTLEAMRIMREQSVPCLPVAKDRRLVGIVTERDFMPVAARLLEERLRE